MDKEKKIAKIDREMAELKAKMADHRLCEGTAMAYTRVSGYHRPCATYTRDGRLIEEISNANTGKAQEIKERKPYNI